MVRPKKTEGKKTESDSIAEAVLSLSNRVSKLESDIKLIDGQLYSISKTTAQIREDISKIAVAQELTDTFKEPEPEPESRVIGSCGGAHCLPNPEVMREAERAQGFPSSIEPPQPPEPLLDQEPEVKPRSLFTDILFWSGFALGSLSGTVITFLIVSHA